TWTALDDELSCAGPAHPPSKATAPAHRLDFKNIIPPAQIRELIGAVVAGLVSIDGDIRRARSERQIGELGFNRPFRRLGLERNKNQRARSGDGKVERPADESRALK